MARKRMRRENPMQIERPMRRWPKKKSPDKVAQVMEEFKEGELPIGKSNKMVTNRKQAVAIALSEARKVKRGKKKKRK